jgi:hypothetical protein
MALYFDNERTGPQLGARPASLCDGHQPAVDAVSDNSSTPALGAGDNTRVPVAGSR